MDLKDFIKETIKDISEAISESNSELSSFGTIVNPKDVHPTDKKVDVYGFLLKKDESADYRRPVHLVNFDIAVSSTTKKDGKEGIGVNVVGIKLGKDGGHADESNMSSKLRFSIPVALPVGEK
ncbi:hypothetical protein Pcar_3050 [Syntrophotalea carbinolica DSM 2380]|uniref:Uncharacterized protein n=1 Tax=Syntrophotalea carbinolica (strain DSM 2380 / NBRC 103641 / GraBd1) TaxID=338963 RepID=Q3A022_SYNC1|nr:hypothetical protein [Syntrophotalea carbinolica]ABA90285.1 hypothetical protein Pcar_3050 [Syntrophotalea carbinolica DSM 2380]